MARKRGSSSRKQKKVGFDYGVVHIKSTFNNTIITLTDKDGNTLTWASGGTVGFEGTRKEHPTLLSWQPIKWQEKLSEWASKSRYSCEGTWPGKRTCDKNASGRRS